MSSYARIPIRITAPLPSGLYLLSTFDLDAHVDKREDLVIVLFQMIEI